MSRTTEAAPPSKSRSTKARSPNERAQPTANRVEPAPRTRARRSHAENAIYEPKRSARHTEAAAAALPGRGALKQTQAAAQRTTASELATSVPLEVEKRFVRVGRKFYFPDGARAFTDRGRRLTTPSENTEVIKSLIAIAQARGWRQLVVTGTERFRREAWLAAQAAGLEARGYRPNEFEQARAVRARARHEGRSDTRDQWDEATKRQPAPGRPSDRDFGDEARHKGWIRGRLVDHGAAKYQHDPANAASYFVKVETEQGERTLWGVDLERALKQSLSQPKVGDDIGMRVVGRDPVTVKSPAVNGKGEVVGVEERGRHRNRWVVERQAFLKERSAAAQVFADAKVEPPEGARRHPELLGSYLQLQSAKALAAERIRDPQDQKRFVDRIRQVLAQSMARGEPLAPVRLREAPSRRAARREAERVSPLVR
jgi:hypothetical protein